MSLQGEDGDTFCQCARPTWVAGMMYVSSEDVYSVWEERKAKHLPGITDEKCEKEYHPDWSEDIYG